MKYNQKYTAENLRDAVEKSNSLGDLARYFGIAPGGGARDHIKKRCFHFGIDISKFPKQGWQQGKPRVFCRKPPDEILVLYPVGKYRISARLLRRALLDIGVEKRCLSCGLKDAWNNKPIEMEIDHIDGNYLNCIRENLRFLCPNCHSQTNTYKAMKRVSVTE